MFRHNFCADGLLRGAGDWIFLERIQNGLELNRQVQGCRGTIPELACGQAVNLGRNGEEIYCPPAGDQPGAALKIIGLADEPSIINSVLQHVPGPGNTLRNIFQVKGFVFHYRKRFCFFPEKSRAHFKGPGNRAQNPDLPAGGIEQVTCFIKPVFCAFAQHCTVLANTANKFIFIGTFDEYIAELPFFCPSLDMNNIVNFR